MEAVQAATEEEINAIDGFGGVMTESVLDFFAKDGTQDLVRRLREAGVNMRYNCLLYTSGKNMLPPVRWLRIHWPRWNSIRITSCGAMCTATLRA